MARKLRRVRRGSDLDRWDLREDSGAWGPEPMRRIRLRHQTPRRHRIARGLGAHGGASSANKVLLRANLRANCAVQQSFRSSFPAAPGVPTLIEPSPNQAPDWPKSVDGCSQARAKWSRDRAHTRPKSSRSRANAGRSIEPKSSRCIGPKLAGASGQSRRSTAAKVFGVEIMSSLADPRPIWPTLSAQ